MKQSVMRVLLTFHAKRPGYNHVFQTPVLFLYSRDFNDIFWIALWGRKLIKHLQRPISIQILIENLKTGSCGNLLAFLNKLRVLKKSLKNWAGQILLEIGWNQRYLKFLAAKPTEIEKKITSKSSTSQALKHDHI
jgi:hypothetical protein